MTTGRGNSVAADRELKRWKLEREQAGCETIEWLIQSKYVCRVGRLKVKLRCSTVHEGFRREEGTKRVMIGPGSMSKCVLCWLRDAATSILLWKL